MAATWTHPTLGTFKYDGMVWIATIEMSAFAAFSFDTGYTNARQSEGQHQLVFEAEGEADLPSPAAVALAELVLANQQALVPVVARALWDDFAGTGPESGMWWHGHLDQVAEAMDAAEPPAGPDDLLHVMQLSVVSVRKAVEGYDRPIVELSFHALFEEEHGVSLLTDGRQILGTGYALDVGVYQPTDGRPDEAE